LSAVEAPLYPADRIIRRWAGPSRQGLPIPQKLVPTLRLSQARMYIVKPTHSRIEWQLLRNGNDNGHRRPSVPPPPIRDDHHEQPFVWTIGFWRPKLDSEHQSGVARPPAEVFSHSGLPAAQEFSHLFHHPVPKRADLRVVLVAVAVEQIVSPFDLKGCFWE
jgi:hypothetical protein